MMFDLFGESDPREMPPHFFARCAGLDYDSAVKADVSKQNFSVAPRHWYVEAMVLCELCKQVFRFSADEQRTWYEEYGFYVDSFPKHCQSCRNTLRQVKELRFKYERNISNVMHGQDCDAKQRMIEIIDQLCEANVDLPARTLEYRKILAGQVDRHRTE